MKNRKSIYIKSFLAFIAGTVFTDSLNGLYSYYLNKPATEFIVSPPYAFLGLVFVLFIVIFVIFMKTRWDG